jgi:hypothetical protein
LQKVSGSRRNVRDDVKVVIEGAQGVFSQSPILSDFILSDGKEARVAAMESKCRLSNNGKQRRRN